MSEHTPSIFSFPSVLVLSKTDNHSWFQENKRSCGWDKVGKGPGILLPLLVENITIHQAASSLSSLQTIILLHTQMIFKPLLSRSHGHTKYGRDALTQVYLPGPKLTIRYFMWPKWTMISCSWDHKPTNFQVEAVNAAKFNLQLAPGTHKAHSERPSIRDSS